MAHTVLLVLGDPTFDYLWLPCHGYLQELNTIIIIGSWYYIVILYQLYRNVFYSDIKSERYIYMYSIASTYHVVYCVVIACTETS